MKTKVIFSALLFGATAMMAQAPEKKATVRIKKVENVNGVERVSDTTYTTNDLSQIKIDKGGVDIKEIEQGDGKTKQIIMIQNEENGLPAKEHNIVVNEDGTIKMDGKILNIEEGGHKDQTVIIKKAHCGATPEEIEKIKSEVQVFIIKNIDITDASESDLKKLNALTGITDNKLTMGKMDFYPNPNNGKFNLRFDLKNKGNTSVNVMNMEGKTIYSEKLDNFSGTYDKEIDISKNPKGVYFVRVAQGDHAQLKKIVLE